MKASRLTKSHLLEISSASQSKGGILPTLEGSERETIVIVLAMERAPTASTSQPPAATTPHRGRPKPPEPKRSQLAIADAI